ncbi:protein SDA1 homolog isoform X1 [Papaver somniferum]|uniref:protein SDA1 homolog isoform X1 n=1 Tax=Papaver somniferum TaxID=3469 RepID=UPI000E702DEE|nr:protein SDA1 homolog isoform X1 [Papaver somniferum]
MACHSIPDLKPEWLGASGKTAEKMNLLTLQHKMKIDPEGYETELALLYKHFDSLLFLFQQQSALSFSSINGDPTVSKDLGDMAMFLAHVTPYYPTQLSDYPCKLADLLRSSAKSLPSSLRCHLTKALILLINRNFVDIGETLGLFMELQTLGDRTLRKDAFSHVIHSIRRMNQKHKNETQNRPLQNILFTMLQEEDEAKAKRALIVLCDLHRRRVWFDERTANAICTACFHPSSKIMNAALSFLLGFEKIEEADDSDVDSSEDEKNPQVVLQREDVYKAHHKGTLASKKKKQAKLQRAIRSMKRQQRANSEKDTPNYYSPLNHLIDAQGFAEKLFSRLQTCNERFEVSILTFHIYLEVYIFCLQVKMMILKVIARTVGLHRLILLNFYPFLQKYVQPHQRDITELLASAVQACHDMVPPDAVEPLFRQVVNQFVHDKSRTEAIAVGLNVVREICLRIPLLMTEDLLQDLVLYRKSHEKAISTAARSLITLFREVCPSLLVKKDRGRPTNPKARPKAFGEVNIASNVSGLELLQNDDGEDEENDGGDSDSSMFDNDEEEATEITDNAHAQLSDEDETEESDAGLDGDNESGQSEEEESDSEDGDGDEDEEQEYNKRKRKLSDYAGELNADTSLRALKRIAESTREFESSVLADGILSNEDFKRIKELKAKEGAKLALGQHGLLRKGPEAKSPAFKVPSSEELSLKRVNPSVLEINIRRKMTKEERLELVKAGREDRGKYQARAAIKQKKTGGTSNKQKEHKKNMPMVAKRAKIVRSRQERKRLNRIAGKQFRGKKAWK